ncbi:hypothetical protein FOL47_001149 [Perkinsus chesapeaki]|uniref:EF-hand domain-containing protein n=1 Tax=Perkinsus chesapeaki TaxID=330153 RepID=A0A7J6MK38_PERCH|nr:hypothetical protein FOL47_001149 [Perkinsus chesapeaki]
MFIPPGGYGFQFSRYQQQQYNGGKHPAVSSAATQRLYASPREMLQMLLRFSAPITNSQTVRTTGGLPIAPSPMPPPPPFSPPVGGYSNITAKAAAPRPTIVQPRTVQAASPSIGTPDILKNYPLPATTPSSAGPQSSYSPVRTLYSNTPTPLAPIQVQVETKLLSEATEVVKTAVDEPRKDVDKVQVPSNGLASQQPERKVQQDRPIKRAGPPRPSDVRRPSQSRKSLVKAGTPSTAKVAGSSTAKVATPSTDTKPPPPRGRQVNKRRSSALIQLSPPKKEAGKALPAERQTSRVQQSSTGDAQLDKLKNVRRTAQLRNVPVGEAMRHFRDHCNNNDIQTTFTLESFGVAYRGLMESCGIAPSESDEDITGVFDVFDRDRNGCLDLMEVVCGLCLICSGTEKEKLQSVFDAFDADGDGQISLEEMTTFLCYVYRIVLTKTVIDRMKAIGVTLTSPERLASVTAKGCFASIDCNHDGMITCDEFHNWFCAPQRQALFVAGTLDGVFV